MKANRNFLAKKNSCLDDYPTHIESLYTSKQDYKNKLEKYIEVISNQQNLLYSSSHYSLLLIIQGMDTAGKDGIIKHVLTGINPQGCQVYSFKQPSVEELQHDFLWRANLHLPQRGHIGVFNRSYYEEVLIVKVHSELLQKQMLPKELLASKNLWKNRYHSIVEFEKHLYRNGTRVIKFFLHLSNQEQQNRLLKRVDDPEKNWKLNVADIEERALWPNYMRAYEECLNNTCSTLSPWYIIPADDKKNARLMVAKILMESLQQLKLSYPIVDKQEQDELDKIRKMLLSSNTDSLF